MSIRWAAVLVLSVAPCVFADVFSYECDSFPDQAGWDIVQIVCDPTQWLDDVGLFTDALLLGRSAPRPPAPKGPLRSLP